MTQVPTYEEFILLQQQVERQGLLLEQLLNLQPAYLTINQTTKALNCSRTTVHRLTKLGKLHPQYEGTKPLYAVAELRTYIRSTHVSDDTTELRILSAQHSQDKTR